MRRRRDIPYIPIPEKPTVTGGAGGKRKLAAVLRAWSAAETKRGRAKLSPHLLRLEATGAATVPKTTHLRFRSQCPNRLPGKPDKFSHRTVAGMPGPD